MDSEVQCPIALKWAVKYQALVKKLDGSLESHTFETKQFSGIHYGLIIYPNGRSEAERGSAWVGLRVVNKNIEKVEADFTITVESSKFKKSLAQTFNQSTTNWAGLTWSEEGDMMCTHCELLDVKQNFIMFDELMIKVEGVFTIKQQPKVKNLTLSSLSSCLWERGDKDFVIADGEKEFKVHKLVLAARSKYFENLFSNDKWQENINGRITIEGFSGNVIEMAINFFYDRDIKTSDLLTLPDAMSLFEFSNMHFVDDLKDNIEMFLIGSINVANVCELTNFSLKDINAPKLQKYCFDFLMRCLKSATPVCKFDELNPEFSMKLLKEAFYAVSETS